MTWLLFEEQLVGAPDADVYEAAGRAKSAPRTRARAGLVRSRASDCDEISQRNGLMRRCAGVHDRLGGGGE